MDKFLSRKRTFDDNKASTSAQTSIVPKIKSRKYSQEYLNFGFTITEVNGEEKPCVLFAQIYWQQTLDEATDSNKDAHFIAYVRLFGMELWFQQDGATFHTARATIDLLKDTFGNRLISRFGPVNWPPRSCDLTPLDYCLWGYVKSLVYADKLQTLHHLEDNIRRVIADIRPQMLEKVIENWTSRLDYIRASHGSPIPEIQFEM
ncbi:putative transposable element [Trichonephila clavipes]|nr:putative transposable element [Trichonephila clavipes]